MNELTREEIDAFLDSQTVGRLGCNDADGMFVVPLIYARRDAALYVLTTEGRKVRAARAHSNVCFETDEYDSASGSWKSVIVWGRFEELDEAGKSEAIAILSGRFGTRRQSSNATKPSERNVVAFRIVIEKASGRQIVR
jgi:nitroimidazol reductase NimA-like FMN-containing flavoprotein (pyridoxamine 5'-phosphate oxidase superfamily)